jgi:hypothetical protein
MRPYAVTEVDATDDLAAGEVDDNHVASVAPGFADARIAVNRHIGSAAIGRCCHLMTGDAIFLNDRDLFSTIGIDDTQTPIALIRNQQDGIVCGGTNLRVAVERGQQ